MTTSSRKSLADTKSKRSATNPNERNKNKNKKRRIRKVLTNIAPQLAHALGGPLAGAAAQRISRALFGQENADEDAIDLALTSLDPEKVIALKRADLEFQKLLQETTIEQARIAASDRANARQHQHAMQDRTQSIIGSLVIIGFFIVLGVMVARRLPEGAETEFSIMLGALATMTAAVVNYFFGSSAGSKEKTKLISFLNKNQDDFYDE